MRSRQIDAIDIDELRPDVEQELEVERAMSWKDAVLGHRATARGLNSQPGIASSWHLRRTGTRLPGSIHRIVTAAAA